MTKTDTYTGPWSDPRDTAQHHNIIERKAMISLQMKKNIVVCVVLFNKGTFIVIWHVLKRVSTRNP